METVLSCEFFFFESRQIQNLQLKLQKDLNTLIRRKETTWKIGILQSLQ